MGRPAPEMTGEYGMWTGYRMPADGAGRNRLVQQLYDYWVAVTPPDRLPGRQHIQPEDIVPLWSRLWLLDVCRDPLRYRYRRCGTEIVRSLGREVTGCWLDEVHPQLLANLESRERFRFMAETGSPTWRRGPPLWTRDPEHRTIESCVMPLAADGRTVDMLLGVSVLFDSEGRQI